jgi:hypothetical protein
MKNPIRILTFAGLLLGAASIAFAGPGPQYWETMRRESQFKQLHAGDKIAYVCKQCDTVSVQTVENTEQAMALCKEGATVTCPSCKMTYHAVQAGPMSKGGTPADIKYVNDKGEECLFIVKLPAEK